MTTVNGSRSAGWSDRIRASIATYRSRWLRRHRQAPAPQPRREHLGERGSSSWDSRNASTRSFATRPLFGRSSTPRRTARAARSARIAGRVLLEPARGERLHVGRRVLCEPEEVPQAVGVFEPVRRSAAGRTPGPPAARCRTPRARPRECSVLHPESLLDEPERPFPAVFPAGFEQRAAPTPGRARTSSTRSANMLQAVRRTPSTSSSPGSRAGTACIAVGSTFVRRSSPPSS